MVFLSICLSAIVVNAQDTSHSLAVTTLYLHSPVEVYRQIRLTGELSANEGRATLVLDPNQCEIGEFGDVGGCTKMAATSRTVRLTKLRIADPLNLGRSLWMISGAPLSGDLFLVEGKENEHKEMRLVYAARNGSREVLALHSLDSIDKTKATTDDSSLAKKVDTDLKCSKLERTVDGTRATATIRPGFLNDTFFLLLDGKKPHGNTWVELKPVVYVQQPDYWQIDVLECRNAVVATPVISPYGLAPQEISQFMGKKGVELHWANGEILRLEK